MSTRAFSKTSRQVVSGCRDALHKPGPRCQRSYYSYDHPAAVGAFGSTEEAILSAAYKHVPEHGFSTRAIGHGARDAGYLDISPSVLPDGAFSLIRYHLVSQREILTTKARELFKDQESPGPGARARDLTWARLLANRDVIHHWQEALAVMAQPSHVPTSLNELAKLSDEIWFLAGDTAVDSSWYTKRATLSMIYTTTELFMTNDKSPDFVGTKNFLARRLDEVQSIGGAASAIGQWSGFTFQAAINVLRSKGVGL